MGRGDEGADPINGIRMGAGEEGADPKQGIRMDGGEEGADGAVRSQQLCRLVPGLRHCTLPNLLQLGQLRPCHRIGELFLAPAAAAAEEQECFPAFVSQAAWLGETSPPASGFHLWPFGEHEGCWALDSL